MSYWKNFETYDSRRKLADVIKTLTQCDKVSLVFLLCKNAYKGKRVIEYLLSTCDPASQNQFFCKWMVEQPLFNDEDWAEKLSEPLTIIQSFKVASLLGFKEEELYDKFEPKNNLKSSYVSTIKKVLFNLCEIFTREEVKKFIALMEDEYGIINNMAVIDESHKHLEYRLLTWSAEGFINVDDDKPINLKPLYKHLLHFNQKKIIGDIEKITSDHPLFIYEDVINHSPDYYNIIDKNNLGLCVIINEKNFIAGGLGTRLGTEKDVERLEEVFTAFGFEVKEHRNVSYTELMTLLDFYRRNISENHSCFVLIILSHGSENVIYTSDLVEVTMNSIEMKFQGDECPNLIGKPKIFIIQSCQGEQWQIAKPSKMLSLETDAPNVSEIALQPELEPYKFIGPQKGDSIIAWSTVQGYASFRDPYNGSWYIEELCKQLWRCGESMDLVDILTLVNNNLRSKIYDGQVMVPSLLLSVRAKVKFPFLRKSQCRGRRTLLSRLVFEKYFKEFLNENFKTVLNQQSAI